MNGLALPPALLAIGLTPALAQRLVAEARVMAGSPAQSATRLEPARVVEVQRAVVRLHDGGRERDARLLPALHQSLRERAEALAVGDWVLCRCDAHGDYWVVAQVPANNRLVRRGADGEHRQALVANVDTALLACGLDGDFNLRRLERYLAFVRIADVRAVVVLTKADLADDVEARTTQVRARLRPGEAVVAVNALDDSGWTALEPWLVAGHTLVLLGSSGVGKSTLTNLLTRHAGTGWAQATGTVRAGDSRGRHTTTARSLHLTPSGACIIDTPGLRTLRLDADEAALRGAFDDIESLAQQCRFRDCRHRDEPGCAVRPVLPTERIAHYDKLLREVRRDTMTRLDRRDQLRQFKARSRAARARLAAKGR